MWMLEFLFGIKPKRAVVPEPDEWSDFKPPSAQKRQAQAYHIAGDGAYDFDIVGEASYQNNLINIVGGKTREGHEFECLAVLAREPTNQYDKNAVRVEIEGRTVGYIPRSHTAVVGSLIVRMGRSGRMSVDAIILGGWRRGDRDEGSLGVKLDLPLDLPLD